MDTTANHWFTGRQERHPAPWLRRAGMAGAAAAVLHAHGGPHGRRGRRGFPFGPGMEFGPGGPLRGFGRGPRARRGDVRAAVLLLLDEQPRNGYQLIQEIEQRSGGSWRPSPGSIYPLLQQLVDEGLVLAGGTEARRTFELTAEGRTYVADHRGELGTPWDEAADAAGEDVTEMRSLVMQTVAALHQVMHVGTEAQRREAAELVRGLRRSLYRILAEEPEATGTGEAAPPQDGA